MNVLSLFDGMSCGQLALNYAGIKYDNYFASEIDKYAISVTEFNYPDTIQLGDVKNWREWDLPEIDLLLAGSPCQGFSMAGTKLNFDDPRSRLFFDFVDILVATMPKVFLLENVKMRKDWEEIISEYVGGNPIEIDSALVSAQSRKRLYWTNLSVNQPEDENIYLKDILFYDASEPLLHNIYGGFKEKKPRTFWGKSPTIRTSAGGGHIPSLILTDKALEYMDRKVIDGRTHWDFKHHSDYREDKSACVTRNAHKGVPYNVLIDEKCIRYLHPVECERLQTIPDNYTEFGVVNNETRKISKTQRYKMIGNGWTVKVIAHIVNNLKEIINGEKES